LAEVHPKVASRELVVHKGADPWVRVVVRVHDTKFCDLRLIVLPHHGRRSTAGPYVRCSEQRCSERSTEGAVLNVASCRSKTCAVNKVVVGCWLYHELERLAVVNYDVVRPRAFAIDGILGGSALDSDALQI
jgi:hypothetical protein